MSEYGSMEKNAVRRSGSTYDEYSIYTEYDELDRVVYESMNVGVWGNNNVNEKRIEYYKDTPWITKFSYSFKKNKFRKSGGSITLFTNQADYFDDGSLKYLNITGSDDGICFKLDDWNEIENWKIPQIYYEKKYNSKGKLIYYKDSTGLECKWTYDKKKVAHCEILNPGEGR